MPPPDMWGCRSIRGCLLLLLVLLGGCKETGDFGRVKASVWNDAVDATGAVSASLRGEPVSWNRMTDDERDLRDRAWRFLVPGRTRPWLDRTIAELVATRIVPADAIEPDGSAYYRGLIEVGGRSTVSSYRRISEDASADRRLVPAFAAVAARVLASDRLRLDALARLRTVTEIEAANARARVAENRCLVAWVTAASRFRVSSYRFALEHLFVEAPGPDAVPTERSIGALAQDRLILDGLGVSPLADAACVGDALVYEPAPAVGQVISPRG